MNDDEDLARAGEPETNGTLAMIARQFLRELADHPRPQEEP